MNKKAFVLTGLGYGDEGKGTWTHYLTREFGAHTVIRTGGPQALHTVVTADGKEFTHAQFSSGTICGAKTHLSSRMLIEPYALLNEGRAVIEELGIEDAFDRVTVDLDCLLICPWHAMANRIIEVVKAEKRVGSVGIGVGECIRDSEKFQEDAIRAKDIGTDRLFDKLVAVREMKLQELAPIIVNRSEMSELVQQQIDLLLNEEVVEWCFNEFNGMAELVRIVDSSYLKDEILAKEGVVVFEPSQGVLLDRWLGFYPNITLVRTTQDQAMSLLREADYDGEVKRFGITRSYLTRHGTGPFVTEDKSLSEELPDIHNTSEHPWQGKFRVGHLDIVALKYAVEASGGPEAFDGIVVSCLDRIKGEQKVCFNYMSDFEIRHDQICEKFDRNGRYYSDIKVRPCTFNFKHDLYQSELNQALRYCVPIYTRLESDEIVDTITYNLKVPVVAGSYGPADQDKKQFLPL